MSLKATALLFLNFKRSWLLPSFYRRVFPVTPPKSKLLQEKVPTAIGTGKDFALEEEAG